MKILTDRQFDIAIIALNIAQITSQKAFENITTLGLTTDRQLYDNSNMFYDTREELKKADHEDYFETFYEIVAAFYNDAQRDDPGSILENIENTKGRGGMWLYAMELTEKFEELHKDKAWGESDDDNWFDAIEEFLKDKL